MTTKTDITLPSACAAAEEYARRNPNYERSDTELYNAFMAGVAWQPHAAVEADRPNHVADTRKMVPSDEDWLKEHERLVLAYKEAIFDTTGDFTEKRRAAFDTVMAHARLGQPAASAEPLCWVPEDELPASLPSAAYDALYPYSRVDFIREFPVFGPSAMSASAKPVGKVVRAGPMYVHGTTMAVFKADEVPVDTKPYAAPAVVVTEEMVSRFLGWHLPDDFAPDCGISFKPSGHPNGWPIGTNLLTAPQAQAMLEYVLGAPVAAQAQSVVNQSLTTEREVFEAKFPMPEGCERDGDDYSGLVETWDINIYRGQWKSWRTRAALAQQDSDDIPYPHLPGGLVIATRQQSGATAYRAELRDEHDRLIIGGSWHPTRQAATAEAWAIKCDQMLAQQPSGQDLDDARLTADHQGMRVDYSGLLKQARGALARGIKEPALAEMLRQMQDHMTELGRRWYAGDAAVVDEILQLYCIEHEAREALKADRAAKGE